MHEPSRTFERLKEKNACVKLCASLHCFVGKNLVKIQGVPRQVIPYSFCQSYSWIMIHNVRSWISLVITLDSVLPTLTLVNHTNIRKKFNKTVYLKITLKGATMSDLSTQITTLRSWEHWFPWSRRAKYRRSFCIKHVLTRHPIARDNTTTKCIASFRRTDVII